MEANDKSRWSTSKEVLDTWEVYDDKFQFMQEEDYNSITEAIQDSDPTFAWRVWSAEDALCDAHRLAGLPLRPNGAMRKGSGTLKLLKTKLGRPKIRSLRGRFGDNEDSKLAHPYRDKSLAPILDQRRRLRAVCGVAKSIEDNGFSITLGLELSKQVSRVLQAGPVGPLAQVGFQEVGDRDQVERLFQWILLLRSDLSDILRKIVSSGSGPTLCPHLHSFFASQRLKVLLGCAF